MARLPMPGQDNGVWGAILNDFLSQSHDGSGALNSGVVSDAQVASGAAIAQSKISNLTSDLSSKLTAASNLSDVANATTARTNLSVPKSTGFTNITVGTTAPSSPAVGDIWIDTN